MCVCVCVQQAKTMLSPNLLGSLNYIYIGLRQSYSMFTMLELRKLKQQKKEKVGHGPYLYPHSVVQPPHPPFCSTELSQTTLDMNI